MYYTTDLHFMLINSIKNKQQTKNDFHKKSLDDVHSKSINDHLGSFYYCFVVQTVMSTSKV